MLEELKQLVYEANMELINPEVAEDLFKEEQDKDSIIVRMTNDKEFLRETKLVELFACEAENMQIFGELTECDYKDKNSVLHIKKLLCEAFSEEFSLCEKRGILSETAKKMIDESEKQPEDICIRLYDISDKKQLHSELKRAFSFPG